MPVHRPVHLLHLVWCVSVCKCVHLEDPFRPVSSEITLGKWQQMRVNLGLRKGSHSAPIMCVCEPQGVIRPKHISPSVSVLFLFCVKHSEEHGRDV